jgi:hypothetical protein
MPILPSKLRKACIRYLNSNLPALQGCLPSRNEGPRSYQGDYSSSTRALGFTKRGAGEVPGTNYKRLIDASTGEFPGMAIVFRQWAKTEVQDLKSRQSDQT